MKTSIALGAASLAALLVSVSACAAAASSNPAPAKAIPAATTRTAPATPDTESAAKAAAINFLTLYSAGQWQATWPLLTAQDQRLVPESLYTAFHAACPSHVAGMQYEVTHVTLAGKTAVFAYTVPLMASMGSVTDVETWTPRGWRTELDSDSLGVYGHGSLKADLKAAKAAGDCASS
jgi:hypothetical protein